MEAIYFVIRKDRIAAGHGRFVDVTDSVALNQRQAIPVECPAGLDAEHVQQAGRRHGR